MNWRRINLTIEYTSPLVVYLFLYSRPARIYGDYPVAQFRDPVVNLAGFIWCFHFVRRVLEVNFVHHFSTSKMSFRNLSRNATYYSGFALLVGYFMNHPKYQSTLPVYKGPQMVFGVVMFFLCEAGNASIHWALRNLRAPDTRERRIPVPTSNPFTWLFHLVSCPNYTYEVGAWLGFALVGSSFSALVFAVAGGCIMGSWAIDKHRDYCQVFTEYPKSRKAILPFII